MHSFACSFNLQQWKPNVKELKKHGQSRTQNYGDILSRLHWCMKSSTSGLSVQQLRVVYFIGEFDANGLNFMSLANSMLSFRLQQITLRLFGQLIVIYRVYSAWINLGDWSFDKSGRSFSPYFYVIKQRKGEEVAISLLPLKRFIIAAMLLSTRDGSIAARLQSRRSFEGEARTYTQVPSVDVL